MRKHRNRTHLLLAAIIVGCSIASLVGTIDVASSSTDATHGLYQPSATETAAAKQTQIAAQSTAMGMFQTATAEAKAGANATATAQAMPPTATPTARVVIATPTPRAATPLAEVMVEGLNIRSGPGTTFAVVGKGSLGQQLPVNGQSGNCAWLRVLLEDGSDGWISGAAAYSSLNVACSAVPGARAAVALPTPTPTVRSVPPATPAQPPAVQPAAAQQAAQPVTGGSAAGGLITSFEPLGAWRRGDQPYGTITQSTAQAHTGAASAAIDYDFPASAGSDNYVVFLAQPDLRIPNGAQALTMQVYGDGSGHFLNAWVRDAGNQVWQLTFGRINHTGWAPMTATLVASRQWPNGPISGATSDQLAQPLALRALVLDGAPDGVASSGVVYLDALTAGSATSAAATSPAATGSGASEGAAASAPAPAAAPTGPLTGKIAFTRFNGSSMDTLIYDVVGGRIIHQFSGWRQPDLTGGYLLVNSEGGGKDTIVKASSNGDNQRPVTINTEDSLPQFSPSLDSMVYASTKNGDRKSRLYWQADVNVQQDAGAMTSGGKDLMGDYPVYLDNWRIAYQGCDSWAAGSKCGIYAADTRSGTPLRVTENTSDIPSGNLGSSILFSSNRAGNWDVWIISFDGSGLQQLTTDPAIDGLATASPDGQSIAFVSNRSGAWAVWVMNIDGGNQRKLFDIGGSYGSGDYDWIRERISWGQ